MNVRIGDIGPADSMERIKYVAKEFGDTEFIPFVYDELAEINDFLEKNRGNVDQWFFSGVMNFSCAIEKKLITEDQGSFPPLHGSSFFGTLLEA